MNSSFWERNKTKLAVLLLILAIASGFYLYKWLGSRDILVDLNLPSEAIPVGQPFDLQVNLTNNSSNALRNVRLALNLPANLVAADNPDKTTLTLVIGELGKGVGHRETFKLVATPAEEPNYKASLTASYSPISIEADLKQTKDFEIAVKKPDFDFQLNTPEKVYSGEKFEVSLAYKKKEMLAEGSEVELRFNYPPNFNLLESDPEPNVPLKGWLLHDEGEVRVRGAVDSPDNSSFSIRAELAMKILGKSYPFGSLSREISVNPSPLSFQVNLSPNEEVVRPGDRLTYTVSYKNASDVSLEDILIKAQLIGEMFDFSSLETKADFNRSNNTLTWNASNLGELKLLDPGREGQQSFSIKVKSDYPIQKLNDKNFLLKLNAKIESPTVPRLVALKKTVNSKSLETKIGGKTEVTARAYFRDAPAKIVNKGDLPPKVGVPTDYTVHWLLTNYSTDISDIEVRAHLEDGVSFTGKVKGNTDALPQFDSNTREVIWRLNQLPATAGLLGGKPEVVFQLEAVPNASSVGRYLPLIDEITLRAKDKFTGLDLSDTAPPLTTRLADDGTVNESAGLVQP